MLAVMKISENFTEILCIGNLRHKTGKRKFGEVIFLKKTSPKTSACFSQQIIFLAIFRSSQHGQSLKIVQLYTLGLKSAQTQKQV